MLFALNNQWELVIGSTVIRWCLKGPGNIMLSALDEVALQLSMIQDQWQVRLEWYIVQLFNSIKQKCQILISHENNEFVSNALRNWVNRVKSEANVYPFLLSCIRKGQSIGAAISRRVAPKLIVVFGNHEVASASAGFVLGVLLSWLIFRRKSFENCTMKPHFKMTAVTCKEPRDLKR